MMGVVYLQVCPICAIRVGVNMVAHITLQHGNVFKISFFHCIGIYNHGSLTSFCCITLRISFLVCQLSLQNNLLEHLTKYFLLKNEENIL